MKRGFAVFLFVLFAVSVWAQEEIKIGFVDIQRAITESQRGKKAKEKFRAHVKRVEAKLLKEKEKVDRLRSDFNKKVPLLKDEERRNLEREIRKKERGYNLAMRDSQQELAEEEKQVTSEILKDLHKIVFEVGKSEKYTLILERSQVPYSDEGIDITDRVIELYDSRTAGKVSTGK